MVSGIPTTSNTMAYGALKDRVPQNVNAVLPTNVQNLSAQDIQQEAQNTPVGNSASGMFNLSARGKVMAGGFWAGFIGLCSLLNKNFRKEDYNKTMLGKIGAFGDKVSGGLDKIGVGKVTKTLGKGKNKVLEKLPFLTTPTKTVNSMAKSQAYGMVGYQTSDILTMISENLNFDDNLVKLFGENNKKEFAEKLARLKDNPLDSNHLKEIDDIITKLKSDELKNYTFISKKSKNSISKVVHKVFGRDVTGSEMANKTIGAIGDKLSINTGAKTTLGKKLTSGFTKFIEGTTNGYAGGKVMIVIQALVFAGAIEAAIKAPKGEKWSAFANKVSEDFGAFLLLPMQLKLLNGASSIKYMGTGKNIAAQKSAISQYRKQIADINKKLLESANGACKYTRTQYLADKEIAKKLLKGDSKWYHKPFRAIGKVLTVGLDNIKPYTADLSAGGKTLAKFGDWLKRFGGGAGRFAIAMFVISPFLNKIVSKVSSTLFGKTTEMKNEEAKEKAEKLAKKEAKKQGKTNQNIQGAELTEEETNELKARMMASPEILQSLEGNEQALNMIMQNPKALLETLRQYDAQKAAQMGQNSANEIMQNPTLLNSLGIQIPQTQAGGQNVTIPQSNAQNMPPSILNPQTQGNMQNVTKQNLNMPTNQMPNGADVNNIDPANTKPSNNKTDNYTYIPSSEAYKEEGLTQEQNDQVAKAMKLADETEADVMKYI